MRIKTALSIGALSFLVTATATAGAVRPGFSAHELPPTDDGYSPPTALGFSLYFYGFTFTELHVNNNGNVTFDAPLSHYTPFDLTSTGRMIIAPFFADVDTRAAGSPVTYGRGSVDGRFAFGVNWVEIDCYYSDSTRKARNSFQLVLIDRSDIGPGDFDIELNYDQIQWETGQASGGSADCQGGYSARAGFSSGTGQPGTLHELPGSGVAGAFLDSGPAATALIHNSLDSALPGRYRFRARAGVVVVCAADNDQDGDGVCDDIDLCPDTVLPEETVPARHLGVNRWACVDGDDVFDTVPPPGGGPGWPPFMIEDTAGCSCEQIIEALGLGKGHRYFGCSAGVVEQWSATVAPLRASPRREAPGFDRAGVPGESLLVDPEVRAVEGCAAGRGGPGPAGFLALPVFFGAALRRRFRGRAGRNPSSSFAGSCG